MRPEAEVKPVYLVDPSSDPVVVRIEGRVNFQNSGGLRDFADEMLRRGKARFILDFERCTSMDSTFLGVLAGLALELRRRTPAGSLVLVRVGTRNLELVRNLGLHRLLAVEGGEAAAAPRGVAGGQDSASGRAGMGAGTGGAAAAANGRAMPLECGSRSELESARLVLEAHETLCTVDEANRSKFQDVLVFMKQRVEQG
jgi:anti-anti-sigma factor